MSELVLDGSRVGWAAPTGWRSRQKAAGLHTRFLFGVLAFAIITVVSSVASASGVCVATGTAEDLLKQK